MVMKLQIFKIKKIPEVDSSHTCLAVISSDSALNKDGNHYRHVFPKECKCIKKKVIRHIIYDLESSSHHSHDTDKE